MGKHTKIWKCDRITLNTKIRIVKGLVFPKFLWESEFSTLNKINRGFLGLRNEPDY